MEVVTRWASLSVSETAELFFFFFTQPSLRFTKNGPKQRKHPVIQYAWMKKSCWCQRSVDRLDQDDRRATVAQIITWSNQDVQKTKVYLNMSNLEADGLQQQKKTPGASPSAKNRKLTQTHQNWTIRNLKTTAWSDDVCKPKRWRYLIISDYQQLLKYSDQFDWYKQPQPHSKSYHIYMPKCIELLPFYWLISYLR